jgi:hypothetical protein
MVRNTKEAADLPSGITLSSGARLVLARTALVIGSHFGLTAAEATVDAEDVLVGRVGGDARQDDRGHGLRLSNRSQFAFRRTAVVDDARLGLAVLSGSVGTADDLTVARQDYTGVLVSGPDSRLEVVDLAVTDTFARPIEELQPAAGLAIEQGATATVERALFRGNRGAAVLVRDPDTVLTATDVRLEETALVEVEGGEWGRHVAVELGGRFEAVRVEAMDAAGRAFTAHHAGTELALEDVRLARSGLPSITVTEEAAARVHRADIEEAGFAAVLVGNGASLELEDVTARESRVLRDLGGMALGLSAIEGADLTVRRAHLDGMTLAGVFVGRAHAELEDIDVADTQSHVETGRFGAGLHVQLDADATVRRGTFSNNRGQAINTMLSSRLDLEHVVLEGTRPRACFPECDAVGGTSLGAFFGARVQARHFVFRDSGSCGVHLAEGAAVDLHDGVVAEHRIGACVQVPGFDTDRLSNDVEYRDNDRNLDSVTLPTPDPIELEGLGASDEPTPEN